MSKSKPQRFRIVTGLQKHLFPTVVRLARLASAYPWTEAELNRLSCTHGVGVYGLRLLYDGKIPVAYVMTRVYIEALDQGRSPRSHATFRKAIVDIVDLAVAPNYRRRGLAKGMLTLVEDWLSGLWMRTLVRETNLTAQQFLKGCGYRAISVHRQHYSDTLDDAYEFRKPPSRDRTNPAAGKTNPAAR
jgi:ribosomal protein S18 acetylase RimI-like enzyme